MPLSPAPQGEQYTFSAQFYSPTTGSPIDPTALQFQVLFEDSATPPIVVGPLMLSQLTRTGLGAFNYDWNVPENQAIGDYQVQWIGTVEGIPQLLFDDFEVISPPIDTSTITANQLSTDSHIIVQTDRIFLKFDYTPRAISVYEGIYNLYLVEGSSTLRVENPFLSIAPQDYNSISRVLTLLFAQQLDSNAQYMLEVIGIVTASGIQDQERKYVFATLAGTKSDVHPLESPIYVQDHSISETAFTSLETITDLNPNFYIRSTDPDMNQVFIDPYYANGRITINFSIPPLGNFLNGTYFQVQSKALSRGFNVWTAVQGVQVSIDSTNATVYLDMPSLDATPVYGVEGSQYFQANYKYRVKISKMVGSAID